MTVLLQFALIAVTAIGLAKWGLWRGRKERKAERSDPRQHEITFDNEGQHSQRGAAMSRLM